MKNVFELNIVIFRRILRTGTLFLLGSCLMWGCTKSASENVMQMPADVECTIESDCLQNQECVQNQCVEITRPQCQSNLDCLVGQVCLEAQCVVDVNSDLDRDGVPDLRDNCPTVSNPGQDDIDEDGSGALCDDDDDNDGIEDTNDNCPLHINPSQSDFDGDGIGDACDPDVVSVALCGDGAVVGDEECDDGNTTTETCEYGEMTCRICNEFCQIVDLDGTWCGDGLLQETETCDDANQIEGDGCTSCQIEEGFLCQNQPSTCQPQCGDGLVVGNEECDDGNTVDEICDYGQETCVICNQTCQNQSLIGTWCGNGLIETEYNETCDGETWCSDRCDQTAPPCASSAGGCPSLDWVFVEGGSFMMGNSDYEPSVPVHEVSLSSFEILRTEITTGQYKQCVEANYCQAVSVFSGSCNSRHTDRDDHPINCVSWLQLLNFAEWVGGSLPTEAQWEYVATNRGQNHMYPWGTNDIDCTRSNHSNGGCSSEGTWATCSGMAGNSELGVCDLSGNVAELVLDEYHNSYMNAPNNGDEPWCESDECRRSDYTDILKVIRGGAFTGPLFHLRSQYRTSFPSDFGVYYVGGRLTRSVSSRSMK